jgi:putative CocE/NonD family hydrolase
MRLARITGAAAAVALTLAGATAAQAAWTPPAPIASGVVKTTNVPVRMSDGVSLYVDVVRPADAAGTALPGPFPVLLTQTPYNKNSPSLNFEDDYLVEHGYVQVIADVRGTGSSEGQWASFDTREQLDGAELVNWASEQPFSDGRVAGHGTSYGAINQLFTAELQPPALKAIFPVVPENDAYRDIAVSGGEIDTSFIPLWLGLVSAASVLPSTDTPTNPTHSAAVIATHGQSATAFQAAVIANAVQGGSQAYDGPFYHERSPVYNLDKVRVPTFVVGGWFDLFQRGEPLDFQQLQDNGVPSRLLMGPWYHITAGNGLPAEFVPKVDDLELRWDEHYVKGVKDPGLDSGSDPAPVTYYENGDNHWHTASSWYAPDTHFTALHLGGSASPGTPGTLSQTAPAALAAPDTLVGVPVTGACTRSTYQWTAGSGAGEGVTMPCETDNRANDAAGLSYDLPITSDLHLLGPISANLFVSSMGGKDGQITARVEDVAPDGTATQMTAGWNVLSLRALDNQTVRRAGLIVQPHHPFTQASAQSMPSDGSPVEVDVEVFPTSWKLLAGHHLRLSLQTADEPHLSPSLPQTQASAGNVLSIYHDATHDSQLVIPVRGG